MKKIMKSRVTKMTFILITFLSISCQKEISIKEELLDSRQLKSIHSVVPEIGSYTPITKRDELVGLFLMSESILETQIDFSQVKLFKVKFKGYRTLVGLQIKYIDIQYEEKDIFFVMDTSSGTHFSVIREKIGFDNGNNNPGIVKFSSLSGRLITNDSFMGESSVLIPRMKINYGLNITNPNSMLSIKSNRAWLCTEEQFNAFYQEAKKKCSDDWLCDFACTFNPCAISYVAYAVIKCTGITTN